MPEKIDSEEKDHLQAEVERLKIDNILHKQKDEFQKEFKEHSKEVEKQINNGQLRLGVFGFVALILTLIGAYREFSGRLQERLDETFSTKEIRELISKSTIKVARPIMQERITEFTKAENSKLKCVIAAQGRDIFELQCHSKNGEFDGYRGSGVCIDINGGESYYENPFPHIACDEVPSPLRQGARH